MLARGDLELESDIVSDTAPLATLVALLLGATLELRRMRDATRSGVATLLRIGATMIGRINAAPAGLLLI